jgi:hypothetical protein
MWKHKRGGVLDNQAALGIQCFRVRGVGGATVAHVDLGLKVIEQDPPRPARTLTITELKREELTPHNMVRATPFRNLTTSEDARGPASRGAIEALVVAFRPMLEAGSQTCANGARPSLVSSVSITTSTPAPFGLDRTRWERAIAGLHAHPSLGWRAEHSLIFAAICAALSVRSDRGSFLTVLAEHTGLAISRSAPPIRGPGARAVPRPVTLAAPSPPREGSRSRRIRRGCGCGFPARSARSLTTVLNRHARTLYRARPVALRERRALGVDPAHLIATTSALPLLSGCSSA